MEKKKSEEFAMKTYAIEIEDPRRRRRPVMKSKDSVKEYMHG